MPRGKELEQLPMATTLPGAGEDQSNFTREILSSVTSDERPTPAKIAEEEKE